MTCADYRRWFSPYADGLLGGGQGQELEDHVTRCAGCAKELASFQQMLQALRTMEQPQAPDLRAGIHQKLLRDPWWRRVTRSFIAPWPASLPWHSLALATTGLLVVIVAGLPQATRRMAPATPPLQRASRTGAVALERDAEGRGDQFFAARQKAASVETPAQGGEAGWEAKGSFQANLDAPRPTIPAERASARDEVGFSVQAESTNGSVDGLKKVEQKMDWPASDAVGLAQGKAKLAEQPLPGAALEVRWRVSEVSGAAQEATEWVTARGGTIVAASDRHFSVTLPSAEVPGFLQRFSSEPVKRSGDSLPPVVTISLELVPAQ